MKHPLNWVTLFLMVFIAGIAIHFVLSHVQFLAVSTPEPAPKTSGEQ